MRHSSSQRLQSFTLSGLGMALLVAVFLSPWASQHPDGLDRVAQDLKFEHKEAKEKPAEKLPFYLIFDEYALRGVPEQVATPLAGLLGTLATFGLAYGAGKLIGRRSTATADESSSQ